MFLQSQSSGKTATRLKRNQNGQLASGAGIRAKAKPRGDKNDSRKTKVNHMTNHGEQKKRNRPIRAPTKNVPPALSAGKINS